MSSHLAVCSAQVVPCRYQSLRCKARLPRKQMEQHMKDKDTHLEIAMATTTDLVDELNRVRTMSMSREKDIEELKKQMEAVLKKTDTKVDLSPLQTPPKPWLKEDSFPLYPPCTVKMKLNEHGRGGTSHFTTHPGGYRLSIDCVNGFDISHVAGPNDDFLRWPVEITVKFLVLNQKEDRDHLKCIYSGLITHPSAQSSGLEEFGIPPHDVKFKQDGNVYIKVESVDIV